MRSLAPFPALRNPLRIRGLPRSSTISHPQTPSLLLEPDAQRVTVRRLGDDVERALALGDYAPPPLEPNE